MALPSNINSLRRGQLLMIETLNEILIGNLQLFDSNSKIIELDNVRDFKTNYVYTSPQILPILQIKTIKIIEASDEQTGTESLLESTNNSPDECSTSSSSSPSNLRHIKDPLTQRTSSEALSRECIPLNSRELQSIQDQLLNFNYIYQTDHLYHKALNDIKTQSVISLLLDPMEYGRHSRTSLIGVGTNRSVYIFDIQMLGKVFREFKEILESKKPRKVLHYGHRICDNLKYRQNVELVGVFDTFVAHCLLSESKAHLNFLETVQHYFNISPLYFTDEILKTKNVANKEPIESHQRPLTRQYLTFVAKKVIFQYKLYEHLLHEEMLSNFYLQCEKFSNSFSNNTDTVDVVLQMKPHSRQGFQHIRPQKQWREHIDKQL